MLSISGKPSKLPALPMQCFKRHLLRLCWGLLIDKSFLQPLNLFTSKSALSFDAWMTMGFVKPAHTSCCHCAISVSALPVLPAPSVKMSDSGFATFLSQAAAADVSAFLFSGRQPLSLMLQSHRCAGFDYKKLRDRSEFRRENCRLVMSSGWIAADLMSCPSRQQRKTMLEPS